MTQPRLKNMLPKTKQIVIRTLVADGVEESVAEALWNTHAKPAFAAAEATFYVLAEGHDLTAEGVAATVMSAWQDEVSKWASSLSMTNAV